MKKLLSTLSLMAVVMFFTATVNAQSFGSLTMFTNSIGSNSTQTATSHIPIDVPPNSICYAQISAVALGVGTSNLTVSCTTSFDAQTWTTAYDYSGTVALNGTNPICLTVPIGTNIFGRFLSADKVTTPQTNGVTYSLKFLFLPALPHSSQ